VVLPWKAVQLITQVEEIFRRAEAQRDIEVQSDYAKYLVIRLGGLIEQVVTEIVVTHVGAQASASVLSHASWRMKRFQNPNMDRLLGLVQSFNRRWAEELDGGISASERAALGSIRAQRNLVAHGEPSTVSLAQVRGYFSEIKTMLERVAERF
jgi:RiboL-PSP-HEPN